MGIAWHCRQQSPYNMFLVFESWFMATRYHHGSKVMHVITSHQYKWKTYCVWHVPRSPAQVRRILDTIWLKFNLGVKECCCLNFKGNRRYCSLKSFNGLERPYSPPFFYSFRVKCMGSIRSAKRKLETWWQMWMSYINYISQNISDIDRGGRTLCTTK
jgi:hypothetical protein